MTSMTLTRVLITSGCFSARLRLPVWNEQTTTCLAERERDRWAYLMMCFVIQWSYFCLFCFLGVFFPLPLECSWPWTHASVCPPDPSDPLCETVKTMQHAKILPSFLIDSLCTKHRNLTTEIMTMVEIIVWRCLCTFPVLSCLLQLRCRWYLIAW